MGLSDPLPRWLSPLCKRENRLYQASDFFSLFEGIGHSDHSRLFASSSTKHFVMPCSLPDAPVVSLRVTPTNGLTTTLRTSSTVSVSAPVGGVSRSRYSANASRMIRSTHLRRQAERSRCRSSYLCRLLSVTFSKIEGDLTLIVS